MDSDVSKLPDTLEGALDGLQRCADRLKRFAEADVPPVLIRKEAELIEARIAKARLHVGPAATPTRLAAIEECAKIVDGYGASVDFIAESIRALVSRPEPAATAVTREQIARTLAIHLWSGATYDDATEPEKDAFVNAADAVLALYSATPVSRPLHSPRR